MANIVMNKQLTKHHNMVYFKYKSTYFKYKPSYFKYNSTYIKYI